ncbi:MAG: CIA30 family protein, partial [Cyanobacteria bacterium P01_D01_bin.2]
MGGVSNGEARTGNENGKTFVHLTGDVSTANNGGFIQVRRRFDNAWPADAQGLKVSAKGNGERYYVFLRTKGLARVWYSYRAEIVRAIADIETEPIEACHRDFLRYLQVRANLVVPILTSGRLWGLLAAHSCQGVKTWSEADIERMQAGALTLASSPSIRDD